MRGRFRSAYRKRLMSEINVVPYIDVTLILLIIFMITAPIVQQAVTVDLPQTPRIKTDAVAATEPVEPFVITVMANGLYKTSQNPDVVLAPQDLTGLVAEVVARSQLKPEQPFYIQGDRQAPYGRVVNLFVLLKSNGVDKVSLMTEPEEN